MNNLDIIRSFADCQAIEVKPAAGEPDNSCASQLAALEALANNNEWLCDRLLVEGVVSRLENLAPQSQEERVKTAAVYMKIMGSKEVSQPGLLNSIKVRISAQKSVELPRGLLMAQSPVLQRQLSSCSAHTIDLTIDLSNDANEETLAHIVTHLTTGQTDFVSKENAFNLLLLGDTYELTALSVRCQEHLQSDSAQYLNPGVVERTASWEQKRQHLLQAEAEKNGITISRTHPGAVCVRMKDGSEKEQWRCLKKIHDYIPITHLELTKNKSLKHLLAFVDYNPDLVSLTLGISTNITDEYLDELSKSLPKLDSFSIHCAPITTIPQRLSQRLTKLQCDGCESLTRIDAPNLLELQCFDCNALTRIALPQATAIKCGFCNSLAHIDAPNVKTLYCGHNPRLLSINAPNVTDLYCDLCVSLMSLEIPNLLKLHCNSCAALEKIYAPKVETLSCARCNSLEQIYAPKATQVNCSGSKYLSKITAPAATNLKCSNCPCITKIVSSCVKKLKCDCCNSLTHIHAPRAIKIYARFCYKLTSIEAPRLATFACYNSSSLSTELRLNLFNTVHRNILLAYYTSAETLISNLDTHFEQTFSMYRLPSAQDTPLDQWLIDAHDLVIPLEDCTEAEKANYEQGVNVLYERLVHLTTTEKALKGTDLSWFKNLEKLNNFQQQMKRLYWLACFLGCIEAGANPMADPDAYSTLKTIGNLADATLQTNATRALLSVYAVDAFNKKAKWKSLKEKKPDEKSNREHLLLLCLLFSCADVHKNTAEELLHGLAFRHYKDYRLLNPIHEMTSQLFEDPSIIASQRERLLKLTLEMPKRAPRENSKLFERRLNAFREGQPKLITACRDLLLVGQGRNLMNVQDAEGLLQRHKWIFKTLFNLKEEYFASFIDTFRSNRHPGGLITYAARLQTLPEKQRDLLKELLGKFVNGHLEGKFPENRYDLSDNPHLNKVFKGNIELFNKWQAPFEIDLTQLETQPQGPRPEPATIVRDLMKQSIDNNHLGINQMASFPALLQTLKSNDPEEDQRTLKSLQKKAARLRDQIKAEALSSRSPLAKKLNNLEIEILSLKALDPTSDLSSRITDLENLLMKLPEGMEFKNDVNGMLRALSASKELSARWAKLQTTEYWEDLLLMGTEVYNSCQRIDGDPDLNKCLLAYILDGKNKLMIVRDFEGNIAARSVLRVLWHREQHAPVLFMELVYRREAHEALIDLIIKGCVQKAKMMGLPLVANDRCFPQGSAFQGTLDALGGPAPFEYVDALRGIQYDGMFTINDCNIVYMPEVSDLRGDLRLERNEGFLEDTTPPHFDRRAHVR